MLESNKKIIGSLAVLLLLIGAVWFWRSADKPDSLSRTEKPVLEVLPGVDLGGTTTNQRKNIFENLVQSKDHTTFMTATQLAGLSLQLQAKGPITVFVPSNAAFQNFPTQVLEVLFKPEQQNKLIQLMNYHMVAGKYTQEDLRDGMKLKTIQGQELTFTQKDGQWWINGKARIEIPDILSSNGVAHGVGTVLTAAR